MKDEIKEIQKKLNYHKSIGIEPTYCEDLITTGELQRLLDYITNLQEEKKIPEKIYYDGDDPEKRIIIRKIDEIIDYLKSKGE